MSEEAVALADLVGLGAQPLFTRDTEEIDEIVEIDASADTLILGRFASWL